MPFDPIDLDDLKKIVALPEDKVTTDGRTHFHRSRTHFLQDRKWAHYEPLERVGRCAARGCTRPAGAAYDGIPYCDSCAIWKLLEIIERLEQG